MPSAKYGNSVHSGASPTSFAPRWRPFDRSFPSFWRAQAVCISPGFTASSLQSCGFIQPQEFNTNGSIVISDRSIQRDSSTHTQAPAVSDQREFLKMVFKSDDFKTVQGVLSRDLAARRNHKKSCECLDIGRQKYYVSQYRLVNSVMSRV